MNRRRRELPVVACAERILVKCRQAAVTSRLAVCAVALLGGGGAVAQSLPTAYDLRSIATLSGTVAWVTSVQDQGTAEDCWSFASATAMNSSLLMQGLLSPSAVPPAPVVSSWHLSTANGNPNQLDPALAFSGRSGSRASNWGGYEYQALGYVTRGSGQWAIPTPYLLPSSVPAVTTFGGGPVANAADALNTFPTQISTYQGSPASFPINPLTPLVPPVNQPTSWRVTNVSILDQGFSNNVKLPTPSGTVAIGGGDNPTQYLTYTFNQGAADPQVQAVKAAILANGAVTTYMNADYSAFTNAPGSTEPYTVNYVNPWAATGNSNHSVTIIGWDDTYSIASVNGATTGAWLVQNSWGISGMATGTNSGTFWASYDDAVIGRSGVASYQLESMAGWSQTVLQNELGPMAYASNFNVVDGAAYDKEQWIGSPTGMAPVDAASVMSILTPASTEILTGLGLATQVANVTVTASIYQWDPVQLTFGPLLQTATFTNDAIGFFVGRLPGSVVLQGGQSYAVQLTYAQGGSAITGAAPVTIGFSGINGHADMNVNRVDPGLSYYLDTTTGQWVDMKSLRFESNSNQVPNAAGGVLFLKGYTSSVPELDPAGWGGVTGLILAAAGLLERRCHQRSRGRKRQATAR